jgi:hypothetical protein
MKSLRGA